MRPSQNLFSPVAVNTYFVAGSIRFGVPHGTQHGTPHDNMAQRATAGTPHNTMNLFLHLLK